MHNTYTDTHIHAHTHTHTHTYTHIHTCTCTHTTHNTRHMHTDTHRYTHAHVSTHTTHTYTHTHTHAHIYTHTRTQLPWAKLPRVTMHSASNRLSVGSLSLMRIRDKWSTTPSLAKCCLFLGLPMIACFSLLIKQSFVCMYICLHMCCVCVYTYVCMDGHMYTYVCICILCNAVHNSCNYLHTHVILKIFVILWIDYYIAQNNWWGKQWANSPIRIIWRRF